MSAQKSSAQNNSKSSSQNISVPNIMNTKYFSTFTLQDLGKEPTNEWSKDKKKTRFINKNKWKRQTLNQLKETYMKQNRGIVCGKHSDIVVVDLDFYEKCKEGVVLPFDREKSKFLQDFGEDYIKKFNTLTFKTANGGEHLVFQYTPLIKTTANEEHNIDIRSDNSYIVAPSSVIDKSRYDSRIKKAKDKKGEYTILNAVDIKPLPVELETWLSMNLYRKKREPKNRLKKNCKGEISSKDAYEQDEVDLTQYSYMFDESIMIDILDGLPKSYFRDRVDWYIFTTAMKLLSFTTPEMKELWDMYSDNNGTDETTGKIYYNADENESIWASCNPQNYMCLEHLLDKSSFVSDAKTMLGYNKLRIDNIHTTRHDREEDLEYLDKDSDGKFFNDIHHRYCLCRSDTGTGKTTAFKNYITRSYKKKDGNYKRFISVVSRVSLGKEQVKVFREAGIECFWHEEIDTWYDHEGENIVITIDSLMKMGNWSDFESYDIYLDEYNSLIEYFVDCPNLCNKRTIIWKYFNQLLMQGDRVIMTDADISDNSIRFLLTLDDINRNDIIYINNKYKHNDGIEASELFSYEEFCKMVSGEDKGAMVCLDSKNVGEKFVIDMKDKYDIDFVFYSSDYSGDIDLDAHKFVAFSPKIVYGLDSVMERAVFCYYKGHTISPPAMVQQINRCRNITHLYYLFESKTWKAYKYDNVDEVLFEIQEGKKLVVDYFSETYDKQESDRYDKILASFRFTLDCYNTNKFAHFLRIIKMRGFDIDNELQYNEDKITKTKGLSNKLKEELQGYKTEEIIESWGKVNKEIAEIKIDLDMEINKHKHNILYYGEMDDPKHIEEYIKESVHTLEDKENSELSIFEKVLVNCDWYCREFHKDYKCEFHTPEKIRLKYFESIKIEVQEKINDMKHELLRNYLPETWCDIIDLINLPFEKVGDEKYNVFMRDPQELERLFRTNSYFNKDIEGLSELLEKKKDFDSQKYQSSQSRFIYTQKLVESVGLSWENDRHEMKMSKIMTPKEAEKMQKEYELTFRTRSKKLDFKQAAQVKSTIIRIMKLMFGKKIIDSQATSKMVEKMKMVNGKLEPTGEKKTQKITRHFINQEYLDFCNEIYGFYHKTDSGTGKNQYEIDTCELD